jgi:hypothetical protein
MFLQALVKAGVFSVSGWRPRFGWTTLCVALQRGEGLIQSGVAPDLTVGVAPALQKRPGGVRGQNPDRLGSTAPKGLNTLAQGNALGISAMRAKAESLAQLFRARLKGPCARPSAWVFPGNAHPGALPRARVCLLLRSAAGFLESQLSLQMSQVLKPCRAAARVIDHELAKWRGVPHPSLPSPRQLLHPFGLKRASLDSLNSNSCCK